MHTDIKYGEKKAGVGIDTEVGELPVEQMGRTKIQWCRLRCPYNLLLKSPFPIPFFYIYFFNFLY